LADETLVRRRRLLHLNLVAVVVVSTVVLGYGIDHSGIASALVDPVSHIRAQDESVYAHISLRMAERGGWLTPIFMGRYLLQKPPLLVWISGFSLKLFGPTLAALRAPSLIAAVAATGLIFFWISQSYSLEAGWTAAVLLLSNPLWHTLAKLCYLDMVFVFWVISAVYCLHRDPALESRRFRIGFAACTAAAIMTKSLAGLIPLIVLALLTVIWRKNHVSWARAAQVVAIVAGLAGPWHLYQILVHPQWFWADYVQVQLIGFGTHPPAQSSDESQIWFYLRRLWDSDPVLMSLAILSLFPLLRKLHRRESADSALLSAWIAVVMGALLAFRYRNLPYALYLIPPLAIVAAVCSPRWLIFSKYARAAVLAAVFLAKVLFPSQPWGLPLGSAQPLPLAASIRSYAEQKRPNELIVVSPDDEFYSSTLALPRVRYAFVDPSGVVASYAPHYVYLGITVTRAEFIDIQDLESEFLARLRRWGMNSGEGLGTAIVIQSEAEAADLIRASPGSDFLVPSHMGESLPLEALAGHSVQKTEGGWFLLAGQAPRDPPAPVFTRAPEW
jgi:hypothetical protein